MPLSVTERVIAGLASAYFCWRTLGAIRTGIYRGDGDPDVHAARHPGAFGMTLVTGMIVALLCAVLALAPAI